MANKIAELEWTKKELQRAKDGLEVRVAERTAELSTTTEKLMRSRRRIVNTQEELRKGVAQQLHGPVQNRLLVATHWLQTARKAMGPDMAESAAHLDKAANLIDAINQDDLRSVVRRLHPSLIRVSLEASLRSMVSEFQRSFDVNVHLNGHGTAIEEPWRTGLPEDLRMAIYRVAEEAFSNVLKHANATKVDITLDCPSDRKITVTISDDGCGFDVEASTASFGILSMEDYCGALSGTLQINSEVGKGTTIIASFPVSVKRPRSTTYNRNDTFKDTVRTWPSHGNGNGSSAEHSTNLDGAAVTTLVVVDDQPDFCGLVEDLLKPYNEFKILAKGHDGSTALRLLEELRPDVVLLDVEMPGLHGLDATSEIRSRFPDVRVVLMSAYHQREDLEGDLGSGFVDFIPKAEFSVNRFMQACRRTDGALALIAD